MVEAGTSRQKEIARLSLLQICDDNAAYRTMAAREGAIPPLVALSQSSSARPKLRAKVHNHIPASTKWNPQIISPTRAQANTTARKLIRFPISSGGVADRDAAAAAEPKPPREAVGGGRCGGVTSSPPQSGDPTPTLVVRMLSASFLRFFFGETSRCRPARACK